jgi:hypothetical protein
MIEKPEEDKIHKPQNSNEIEVDTHIIALK